MVGRQLGRRSPRLETGSGSIALVGSILSFGLCDSGIDGLTWQEPSQAETLSGEKPFPCLAGVQRVRRRDCAEAAPR